MGKDSITMKITREPMLIDESDVRWSCLSSVCSRLDECMPMDTTFEVLRKYKVGALAYPMNGAVYWRLNQAGQPVGGCVELYDAKGQVTGYNDVTEHLPCRDLCDDVEYIEYPYYTEPCFFGQHLLPKSSKGLAVVVKDEFTALVGSAAKPQHTWLAVGHNQILSTRLLHGLDAFKVLLLADEHTACSWRQYRDGKAFPNVRLVEGYTGKGLLESLKDEIRKK